MLLLQQKYDVKHLNGFIPAMHFVHINTRRVSRLGGMKTSRLGGIILDDRIKLDDVFFTIYFRRRRLAVLQGTYMSRRKP